MKKLMIATTVAALSAGSYANNIAITYDNYEVMESHEAMSRITDLAGDNNFFHFRAITPLDNQTVVRMNQDTLYSAYVTDLSKEAEITIPDLGDRYISVMVVLGDHYINQVFTTAGTHKIEADTEQTHGMIVVRTEVNANNPEDLKEVHRIQDGLVVTSNSTAPYVKPQYDRDELLKWRAMFDEVSARIGSLNDMQGARGNMNPLMHRLGTATGWGLLPDAAAQYVGYTHDGGSTECSVATYDTPPFYNDDTRKGFFSITMYGSEGWMMNEKAILNKNNIQFNSDDTFTVHFGDCNGVRDMKNHLPVTEGWNFLVRVYEPNLDMMESYELPAAVPVK
ncbi:DUF1254 domain-containing protein [Vibrio profundi]|uniref:DUF1254 domain-containing protein n=1 Tax=Vibrio profundi TaxID=1774960 RepID=UPI003734EE88